MVVFSGITKPLLQKPIKDSEVLALLAIGYLSILRTRIPAHAAIAETVEAAQTTQFITIPQVY
jgi:16S rRNA (cytosine967-C5)-methyltransferase